MAQACSQGVLVPEDKSQFSDNCFEKKMSPVISCFDVLNDALFYLRKHLSKSYIQSFLFLSEQTR